MIVNPYIPLGIAIGGVSMFYLLQWSSSTEQAGTLFFGALVLVVVLNALTSEAVN
jgi:hypothetical protein